MVTEIELEKLTDFAQSVNVITDGTTETYPVGTDIFNEICAEWNNMLDGAHEMPAFGVSLNDYTVKEMKSGVWAEFVFGRTLSANGMPFDRLLVNAQPEGYGFNIIRHTAESGYDGRCFYYDLAGKTTSSFYNCLVNAK
ncbi:MAG: hypothetical protein K2O62_02250 [Clostridia bacterium]|nr:hypothetical protein [Clostridia bacterium]